MWYLNIQGDIFLYVKQYLHKQHCLQAGCYTKTPWSAVFFVILGAMSSKMSFQKNSKENVYYMLILADNK